MPLRALRQLTAVRTTSWCNCTARRTLDIPHPSIRLLCGREAGAALHLALEVLSGVGDARRQSAPLMRAPSPGAHFYYLPYRQNAAGWCCWCSCSPGRSTLGILPLEVPVLLVHAPHASPVKRQQPFVLLGGQRLLLQSGDAEGTCQAR